MQLVEGEGKNKIGGGQKKKEKMKGGEWKSALGAKPDWSDGLGRFSHEFVEYARSDLGIS